MHAIVALACVLACAAAMPSDLFERFMHDYKKSYASEEEKSYRQSIFAKVCRAPVSENPSHLACRPCSASRSSTLLSPSAPTESTSSPT
jgi:hypothetical protein